MSDLIKALQIFLKYSNSEYPTHCEHDILYVDVEYKLVTENDLKVLRSLGFYPTDEYNCFKSYRFGSC